MRSFEFITESPKPMAVPAPSSVDPKSVTDPNKPAQLINQISDIAQTVKETKRKKK